MQEVGREHEHRSMIFLKGKHGILGGLVLFEVNGVDKIPDHSISVQVSVVRVTSWIVACKDAT